MWVTMDAVAGAVLQVGRARCSPPAHKNALQNREFRSALKRCKMHFTNSTGHSVAIALADPVSKSNRALVLLIVLTKAIRFAFLRLLFSGALLTGA